MDVTTSDLYEASWYLAEGCRISSLSSVEQAGKKTCIYTFSGDDLARLQLEYLEGRACVNLLAFRRAYSQALTYANHAKKNHKNINEQSASQGGSL
jgi:hypothetical protein